MRFVRFRLSGKKCSNPRCTLPLGCVACKQACAATCPWLIRSGLIMHPVVSVFLVVGGCRAVVDEGVAAHTMMLHGCWWRPHVGPGPGETVQGMCCAVLCRRLRSQHTLSASALHAPPLAAVRSPCTSAPVELVLMLLPESVFVCAAGSATTA